MAKTFSFTQSLICIHKQWYFLDSFLLIFIEFSLYTNCIYGCHPAQRESRSTMNPFNMVKWASACNRQGDSCAVKRPRASDQTRTAWDLATLWTRICAVLFCAYLMFKSGGELVGCDGVRASVINGRDEYAQEPVKRSCCLVLSTDVRTAS